MQNGPERGRFSGDFRSTGPTMLRIGTVPDGANQLSFFWCSAGSTRAAEMQEIGPILRLFALNFPPWSTSGKVATQIRVPSRPLITLRDTAADAMLGTRWICA